MGSWLRLVRQKGVFVEVSGICITCERMNSEQMGGEQNMDKTMVLNTIQTEWEQFESLLAPLDETQVCTPTLEGGWSIKDIMAHIASWENICSRWLEQCIRGETPRPTERVDDQSNERIYHENRDCSLDEVQHFFQQVHEQFLQKVERLFSTLTQEDITTSHRFAWTEFWPGSSLLAVIADNSYEHYQDHAQQIRRWLDSSRMA